MRACVRMRMRVCACNAKHVLDRAWVLVRVMCMYACMNACVCVCVCVCVRVCMYACVYACACMRMRVCGQVCVRASEARVVGARPRDGHARGCASTYTSSCGVWRSRRTRRRTSTTSRRDRTPRQRPGRSSAPRRVAASSAADIFRLAYARARVLACRNYALRSTPRAASRASACS